MNTILNRICWTLAVATTLCLNNGLADDRPEPPQEPDASVLESESSAESPDRNAVRTVGVSQFLPEPLTRKLDFNFDAAPLADVEFLELSSTRKCVANRIATGLG